MPKTKNKYHSLNIPVNMFSRREVVRDKGASCGNYSSIASHYANYCGPKPEGCIPNEEGTIFVSGQVTCS